MPDTATQPPSSKIALLSLSSYVGKNIGDICSFYTDDQFNHCAHFVSHALQLRMPPNALCSNVGTDIDYARRKEGFCVRVDQVFNRCSGRTMWSDAANNDRCFVVATLQANIKSTDPVTIGDMSKKHIGILIGGFIYNYSNTHKAVATKTVEQFKTHYGPKTVLLRCDLP